MKIGINASFLRKPDSGIGQVTGNFLARLAGTLPDGNEYFIYLEDDCSGLIAESFTKRIVPVGFYRRDDLVRKTIWEKWVFPQAAKRDGCQLLFSPYQSPTITNLPHLMLVHDVIWRVLPQYQDNFRKKVYYSLVEKGIRKANQLMTVSENSRLDMEKWLGIDKRGTVANWIDCDPIFKKELDEKKRQKILSRWGLADRNYIFYFGGLDQRKNVDRLIRAYGQLWKNGKISLEDFPLLVIGGKFHPHLVPLVCDLPNRIGEAVRQFGIDQEFFATLDFVEQEDLPVLYQGAKLFCFPSLYEGFGLPILEAFNSGAPVLAGKNSSVREIAGAGAWLVDASREGELTAGMEKLLLDKQLAGQLVEAGKKRAQDFSWENFVKKWKREMKLLEENQS